MKIVAIAIKIVAESNHGFETVDDILIAENIHAGWASELVKAWNKVYCTDDSRYYLLLKEDSYKLYKFKP